MTRWIKEHISTSHILFLMIAGAGLSYPKAFNEALGGWSGFITQHFDWLVLLGCSGFLLFCMVLAFSRSGAIRLGGQDEKPEYSSLSWFSMLFAAGMGTGLVFYGAAEPLLHFASPPPSIHGDDLTHAQTARQAMVVTYLHWGFHAWAVYAVAALTVAYFTFRQQQPMLASAPLQEHYGWGNKQPMSRLINLIAVLATIFGLVASIGTGIHQTQDGFVQLGWMEGEQLWQLLAILAVLTFCYLLSSLTGLGKGIRWLSNINMIVCVTLMLFVLLAGPTQFILQSFVSSLGEYISRFIALGLNTRSFAEGTQWAQDWTVSYFLWWVAWAPFVAIFIARISRGRTIRQFLLGVILAPTLFSALWFSTFGGAALYQELHHSGELAQVAQTELSSTMFALLHTLPLESITSVISLFLIFIFLVTSADSGSYVLGMFTSEGNPRPPRFQRLFWGLMIAGITGVTLFNGEGLMFLRAVSLSGAMPYMLIMVLQCYALWRFIKQDSTHLEQPFVQIKPTKNRESS